MKSILFTSVSPYQRGWWKPGSLFDGESTYCSIDAAMKNFVEGEETKLSNSIFDIVQICQ